MVAENRTAESWKRLKDNFCIKGPEDVKFYRCGHCGYPLLTLVGGISIRLDCQECGAVSTFHFSAVPQSCKLPSRHQCDHASHTQDSLLLEAHRESYLDACLRKDCIAQSLLNKRDTRRQTGNGIE